MIGRRGPVPGPGGGIGAALDPCIIPTHIAPMTAAAQLRTRTAPLHDAVDAVFGGFRLDDADSYRACLVAHARALPAVEAALARHPTLPHWHPRTALLAQDLAALGTAMPRPLPFAPDDAAAAWGALYVVEGSRLGGAMLARQVGAGLPRAYLAAAHGAGEWRALRAAIDAEGARRGGAWLDAAVAGAAATFDLYRRAAT